MAIHINDLFTFQGQAPAMLISDGQLSVELFTLVSLALEITSDQAKTRIKDGDVTVELRSFPDFQPLGPTIFTVDPYYTLFSPNFYFVNIASNQYPKYLKVKFGDLINGILNF